MIARLAGSGFGDGDWPGDPGSGQASPATTVIARVPRGGTLVLAVGDGVGADVGGDVTGGADVADGEPLVTSVGIVGAELAGADGALLSCVLAGGDGWTEATAPTGLLWLEQPVAVAANATVSTATAACDVVRITVYPLSLHPPPSFTLSLSHPTFIVNRRLRPRES